MNLIKIFFELTASAVFIYSILCFARILITWVPDINRSSFGMFLSSICDPYLNFFSRLPLQFGGLDFTPLVSLGVLTAVYSILGNIALTGTLGISRILGTLINTGWSIINSIGVMLLLVLIIRYAVMLITKNSSSAYSVWFQIDNALSPVVFKISRLFSRGKHVSYKKSLLLSIITIISFLIFLRIAITALNIFISIIPF